MNEKRVGKSDGGAPGEFRRPGAGFPSWRLARRLRDCYRIFTAELQSRLAPHGMRVSDWAHLRIIAENEGLTQVDLSRRLGVEKASSTGVLEKLRRLNIVFGERQETDRRRIGIYLTPHGSKVVERLLKEVVAVNALATMSIDEEELARFFDTLDKIVGNLDSPGKQRSERSENTAPIGQFVGGEAPGSRNKAKAKAGIRNSPALSDRSGSR